jgi:nicotinate phosphoribosyltransferase
MRYGLVPVGTMAHSYVMSFEGEEDAFRAFMDDFPGNAVGSSIPTTPWRVCAGGSRPRARPAWRWGVRLDSGDLLDLAYRARTLLDEAGMRDAPIVAGGDHDENQIAQLIAAGAPIDSFGVDTDLGTSRVTLTRSAALSGLQRSRHFVT